MKKTNERIEGVECPLCASKETTRMEGRPIGKIAAFEMAKGKAFYFCGTCGAGFFALPPTAISDEAIVIGNMITVWLESIWQAKEANRARGVWDKAVAKPGRGILPKRDLQGLRDEAKGRWSGLERADLMMREAVEMLIGEKPTWEIMLGITDAVAFDGTTEGAVV